MGVFAVLTSGARRLTTVGCSAAAAVACAVLPAPSAAADACPDVEVVFARGSGELPGVGAVGGAFVDALRPLLGPRSLGVYAVNYAASTDFSSADFPATFVAGVHDAGSHLEFMAAGCPDTREVLGGYSQGAALISYVTSAAVPVSVPAVAVAQPIPSDIAKQVAAVTLFGTPSGQFVEKYHAPPIVIGPLYRSKTLQLCAPGDQVCSNGVDPAAHGSYPFNGMTNQAAEFAASHL